MATIIGIDPGLVNTGLVVLSFKDNQLTVAHRVYTDTKEQLGQVVADVALLSGPDTHIFIEAYRPRGNNFGTDKPMRELMHALGGRLPKAKVIDNTGMKAVVTTALMKRLEVWTFSTPTHHQDLRSAARIGLYGALKDDTLNRVLYDYVTGRQAS